MASADILPPPTRVKLDVQERNSLGQLRTRRCSLDKLDWKILYELDKNAFHSLSKIGKKLRTGRDVMHYRVKRLESLGVIKKYLATIDYSKLGYLTAALYLKFRHDSPKLREQMIKYYKSRDEVCWLDGMEGNYDLGLWWFARDILSLKETQRDLMKKYRSYIQDYKFRLFNRVFHFRRNFIVIFLTRIL